MSFESGRLATPTHNSSLKTHNSLGFRPRLRPKEPIHFSISRHELSQHSHFLRSVSGAKTLDRDFDSSLDETRFETVSNHPARRAGFEGPLFHIPAGVAHFEEEPGMRVFQPNLSDHTANRHRLIGIERCSE